MDWLQPIDIYCERLGPEFWAEPFNAFTNFSFIIAGIFGLALVQRLRGQNQSWLWTLAFSFLALTIGTGSFLFHTIANKWSMMADVLPITVFMVTFLVYGLNNLLSLPKWASALGVVAFLGSGLVVDAFFKDAFNGSVSYFPAWITLAIVGHFLREKNWPVARLFLVAMGLFAVSLGFRSVDMVVCPNFPLGTHFLWHTLNGALIGVLTYTSYVHSQNEKAS